MSTEKKLTGYPSIDKPWLKYYSEEALNTPPQECTLLEYIYKNNNTYSNDIAIEYFGNKITYKQLFENVDKAKKAFLKLGVKKGDKVIMFTSSTPETIYVILALCRIGAVANMINPLFSNEQIIDRINETDATIMISLDQLYGKIADVIKDTCIKTTIIVPVCNSMPTILRNIAGIKMKKKISYDSSVVKWDNFILNGTNILPSDDAAYEKDRPLVMVYSSGTTGASKGIVLTNDGINATISHYLNSDFPFKRGNTFLQMIPVWFSTGIVLSVLMPICLGITSILEPVFSKESFAKDIKKYKPNMTLGATSLWIYASTCKELKNTDLSFMTYPITGGEQVLSRVESSINAFLKSHRCKAVLFKGYGMCELGSTISSDAHVMSKTGSTGFPILNVTVAAFDTETNKEKKYNERGEIRVLSPSRMKEYFKNPDATNKFFCKDGNGNMWGCTGDIGYIDKEGFVFILGRATDYYISEKGNKIYCFDIENIILENENVAQCEVVGLPQDHFQIPVAHIVLEENCNLSEKELLEAIHNNCTKKLADDCIPYGYKIWKAFPVKDNGKRDMELIKSDKEDFLIIENFTLKKVSLV